MTVKPVVVHGASGYTGRLICEYLRELNVAFIAAGRDKDRLREVMSRVPGIETADYEVAEVAHEAGALTELFRGARGLQHRRPVHHPGRPGGRGRAGRRLPLPGHHRRAGLAAARQCSGTRRPASRSPCPGGTPRPWPCPGAACAIRSGSPTTRGSPPAGRSGCAEPRRDGGGGRHDHDGGGGDQHDAGRAAGGRAGRDLRAVAGRHAAAGEPAAQHLGRLGVRLGSAGSGALCHPWQLRLQADRAAACLGCAVPRPAGASPDRACLGLPGFGHRELLGVLRAFGLVLEPVLTVSR